MNVLEKKEITQKSLHFPQREISIDIFKGFLMIWVIHLHTIFGAERSYIPDSICQISLLIDVPVLFFISGYLMKVKPIQIAWKDSLRKVFNFYLKYLLISTFTLCLVCLFFLVNQRTPPDLLNASLSMLQINPQGKFWDRVTVYGGSLWYLRTYFPVILMAPILSHFSIFPKRSFDLIFMAIVFLCLLQYFSKNNYWFWGFDAQYVSFYLVIYLMGSIYHHKEPDLKIRDLSMLGVGTLFLLWGCLTLTHAQPIPQVYKFPPSYPYFIFCLLPINLFIWFKRYWKFPQDRFLQQFAQLLEWCGKNIYSIYLIQGLVCSIPFYFVTYLVQMLPIPIVCVLLFIFNLSFTLLVTYGYLKLEGMAIAIMETKRPQSLNV
jgi:Acyltransferase family